MDTTSFEYGCHEGRKLLKLIDKIHRSWGTHDALSQVRFGCRVSALDPLWKMFPPFAPRPEIAGFLSIVTPDQGVDAGVVKLMSAPELVEYQTEWNPVCDIPKSLGLLGLAYWTGDSDGDAWVVNLRTGELLSLRVGYHGDEMKQVLEASYAHSPNLAHWRHRLIGEAIRREWLQPSQESELA